MAYLLDTNTISEWRKPAPNPGLVSWLESARREQLYISVLTHGEIRRGIELLRRRDHTQAEVIEKWWTELVATFTTRTIGVDSEIADRWGRLNAIHPAPHIDGLLAATALVRGWTLVTRNVDEVARTGVKVLNPFS